FSTGCFGLGKWISLIYNLLILIYCFCFLFLWIFPFFVSPFAEVFFILKIKIVFL
ncbi:hypothetical protein C0J52_18407, partial [Blattella germanica]